MVLKCSKCGEEKDSTGFTKNKTKKRGFSVWCKLCRREYRAANKEKIADRRRKYYAANKEKIADRHREYRVNNKEKIADRKREYYAANMEKSGWKEKRADRGRKYYANNKEKIADWHRKNYADNKEKIKAANVELLSDSYVNGLIRTQTGLSARDIPDFITELKRGGLLMYREIKKAMEDI